GGLGLLDSAQEQRIKINRRQGQRRETALHCAAVDDLTRIREENLGAYSVEQLRHLPRLHLANHEQTRLLHFHEKYRLVIDNGTDRQFEHHFIQVFVYLIDAGVEILIDLGMPRLLERIDSQWGFKREILQVNTLQ